MALSRYNRPNWFGNADFGMPIQNTTLYANPPFVPNQHRPQPDAPERDLVLYDQSLRTVDPKPVKSHYKPRGDFWFPKREVANTAPDEVKDATVEEQRRWEQRDLKKRIEIAGLDPAKRGVDLWGHPTHDQYIDRRPYGLDVFLNEPTRRHMHERFQGGLASGRKSFETAHLPPVVSVTTMPQEYARSVSGQESYYRSQRDGAADVSPVLSMSHFAAAGTPWTDVTSDKQRDSTRPDRSPQVTSSPLGVMVPDSRPLLGWTNSRRRGPEATSPLPTQITGLWTEGANRSNDTIFDKDTRVKATRESMSYKEPGSSHVQWSAGPLARGRQLETRETNRSQANKRAEIQTPPNFFYRNANHDSMTVSEKKINPEMLSRRELFTVDANDPKAGEIMYMRESYKPATVFQHRGRSLQDLGQQRQAKAALSRVP